MKHWLEIVILVILVVFTKKSPINRRSKWANETFSSERKNKSGRTFKN